MTEFLIALIAGAVFVAVRKLVASTDTTDGEETSNNRGGERKKPPEKMLERIGKVWKFVNSWMLYPAYVFGPYFVIVWVLFYKFFPRYHKWLWGDQALFWVIPTITLIVVWVYKYKKRAPSIFATVMLILMFVAIGNSFEKTDMRAETRNWWKQNSAATHPEKARATQLAKARQDAPSKTITVVAEPGVWSSEQEIPMDGWQYWVTPDGEVDFIADNGPIRRDGPNKLTDYGRTTRKIKFRSAENRNVNVTFTLVPE